MKTFKTRLTESNFESMPPEILRAKTSALLQDHDYDRGEDGTLSHKEESEDTYDPEVRPYHRFNEAKEGLASLGWQHHPHMSTADSFFSSASDDSSMVAHDHFTHPSGLHLVHSHNEDYREGMPNVYKNTWHIRKPQDYHAI